MCIQQFDQFHCPVPPLSLSSLPILYWSPFHFHEIPLPFPLLVSLTSTYKRKHTTGSYHLLDGS